MLDEIRVFSTRIPVDFGNIHLFKNIQYLVSVPEHIHIAHNLTLPETDVVSELLYSYCTVPGLYSSSLPDACIHC